MSAGRVHVVGGGLAGLAAAVALCGEGRQLTLYEAGAYAGGRCRSYFDAELGCRVDNGNHLLLAGNRAALGYLGQIGALDTIDGPPEAVFTFFDKATGQRWTVRPNRGALPWWILSSARRVPDTAASDYLAVLALRRAPASATVAEVLDRSRPLFDRLWEPLAVAALNTDARRASARLFWQILTVTLGRGGAACRPLLPRAGLSETFVDPALGWLGARGARIEMGARLRTLAFGADRVCALRFDAGEVVLGEGDTAILAVPAAAAARLVPGLVIPDAVSPIVNAHFRIAAPPGLPPFIGVVGAAAQWIFSKREVLSVTISAADAFVDRPAPELRDLLWPEVALAYRLPAHPVPPARIVKERRATFRASPDQLPLRPGPVTAWQNLLLAGDYTNTGLPATIEGAIRSGFAAARQVARRGSIPSCRTARVSIPGAPAREREGGARFHE